MCCWFVPACRVPPRRAGNFHLSAQMKVTKAKGLNTKTMHVHRCRRHIGPAGGRDPVCHMGPAARMLDRPTDHTGPLREALGVRYWSSVFGPLRTETTQLDRFDVPRQITAARWTDVPMATVNMLGFGIQALFFGDFLLGQQKKVTRPPGRDPACTARTNG